MPVLGFLDYIKIGAGALVGAFLTYSAMSFLIIPTIKADQFALGKANGSAIERGAWQSALETQRQVAEKQLQDKQAKIDAGERAYLSLNAQHETDKASLQEELAKAQVNDEKPHDPSCDNLLLVPRGLSDKLNAYGRRRSGKQGGQDSRKPSPAVPGPDATPGP